MRVRGLYWVRKRLDRHGTRNWGSTRFTLAPSWVVSTLLRDAGRRSLVPCNVILAFEAGPQPKLQHLGSAKHVAHLQAQVGKWPYQLGHVGAAKFHGFLEFLGRGGIDGGVEQAPG